MSTQRSEGVGGEGRAWVAWIGDDELCGGLVSVEV